MLRTVPYSDIEIIAGVGHCPQVEVPERIAQMLLDFPDAIRASARLTDPPRRGRLGLT